MEDSIEDKRCEVCGTPLVDVYPGKSLAYVVRRKVCPRSISDCWKASTSEALKKYKPRTRPREIKPCENCGEPFMSITTNGIPSRFCKMACFHEHRWAAFRAIAAERTEKPCGHCGVMKPLDEYHVNVRYADGHHNICKPCQIIHTREYALRKLFGITRAEYDAMLMAQGGLCAICGEQCRSGRNLAVDHDHKTGAVRDLLCGSCNTGIGNFRENPEALESAAAYLRRHKENTCV